MNFLSSAYAAGSERDDLALHAHRFLLRAGLAIANVFAWVLVFNFFFAVAQSVPRALAGTLLMYVLSQAITIFLTPIAAAHLRFGSRRALIWGVVLAASAFVLLGATFAGYFSDSPAFWGVAAFAVLLGAYRALYWVPYQLRLVGAGSSGVRKRILYEIVIAFMPLFAGATLATVASAPLRLLFGAAGLIGLSAIPALMLEDTPERFSWHYAYVFKQLFRPKHRTIVLTALLDGVQGASLFLVWPLAIFFIVGWSYAMLGIVFSATLLIILALRGLYASLVHRFSLQDSTVVHTVFAVSGWVARLVAGTPVGLIIADSYSYTTSPLRGTSADPFVFEQATDRGAFVDEYTALKEIALAVGRILLCVLVGILVLTAPVEVAFGAGLIVAALAAGVSVFLARHPMSASF